MTTRTASGALLLLLLTACQPAQRNGGVADDEIARMIEARGEAAVLVALVAPTGFGDPTADADRVRAEIARVQAEVIAALDTADFRVRRRFSNIPSIAGTLRTERGLRMILAHPHVVHVTLEASGGGTR